MANLGNARADIAGVGATCFEYDSYALGPGHVCLCFFADGNLAAVEERSENGVRRLTAQNRPEPPADGVFVLPHEVDDGGCPGFNPWTDSRTQPTVSGDRNGAFTAFFAASYVAMYTACIADDYESFQGELTWFKQSVTRVRYDLTPGEGKRTVTYFERRHGESFICSPELGEVMAELIGREEEASEPFGQRLLAARAGCTDDRITLRSYHDTGAEERVTAPLGIPDSLWIDFPEFVRGPGATPDIRPTYVTTIAGRDATGLVSGNWAEMCFGEGGVMLRIRSDDSVIEAVEVSGVPTNTDFELPFELVESTDGD